MIRVLPQLESFWLMEFPGYRGQLPASRLHGEVDNVHAQACQSRSAERQAHSGQSKPLYVTAMCDVLDVAPSGYCE